MYKTCELLSLTAMYLPSLSILFFIQMSHPHTLLHTYFLNNRVNINLENIIRIFQKLMSLVKHGLLGSHPRARPG